MTALQGVLFVLLVMAAAAGAGYVVGRRHGRRSRPGR
jgi:hypothetical protein